MESIFELDRSILAVRDEIAHEKRRLMRERRDQDAIQAEADQVEGALRRTDNPAERTTFAARLEGLRVALAAHAARTKESRATLVRLEAEHDRARQRRNRTIARHKRGPD